MKCLLFLGVLLGAAHLLAETPSPPGKPGPANSMIDETGRFIFYSVLEGLYEDGVSTADVEQILMRRENEQYFHFVYACPICTPTIFALEAYRDRPKAFYSVKLGGSTFGPGLSEEIQKRLYSEDPKTRLSVISDLVAQWIERRMGQMNLSQEDRKSQLTKLEEKRKEGMNALKSFQSPNLDGVTSVAYYAPAYLKIKECAACNGAVGKPMKLPEDTKE